MNATHLRIISCPREGGEMTGYNPDQQPKCRLTESAFRDDSRPAQAEPEVGSSRTNSGGAASGKRGGTQCRCHAAPRTRSQPSSPRWRKRSSTGRKQEEAGCGTPRCASVVLRGGVEESFRWARQVLRARRKRP